jgi:hypothetical protein
LDFYESVRATLSGPFRKKPRFRVISAAIAHAAEFTTWQSLVRTHGLTNRQAVDVMVAMVCCAAN